MQGSGIIREHRNRQGSRGVVSCLRQHFRCRAPIVAASNPACSSLGLIVTSTVAGGVPGLPGFGNSGCACSWCRGCASPGLAPVQGERPTEVGRLLSMDSVFVVGSFRRLLRP